MIIIIFHTAHGVMYIGKTRTLAAKLMGYSPFQIFTLVIFWEALPHIIIGLKNALSMSLVVIVVTEMFIGTDLGLGRRIIDAQLVYNVSAMYGVIILTGVVGYLMNLFLSKIQRKYFHWEGK